MNLRSTGNSEEKNRKWPKLAMLATAVLLLSAISFVGIGTIPQQAFAANVDQSISQYAGAENDDNGRTDTTQTASQGFCLQVNQQNAAAGDDATNIGANAIVANEG